MEFYLTKTVNWVSALYPHKALRFPAIQSDHLRLLALKQSSTPERVRGGKERLQRIDEAESQLSGLQKTDILYCLQGLKSVVR